MIAMSEVWKPSVTVAAIVEHQGKFLIVEEHTTDGIKLNQPAGHLDPGETPQFGAAREALEESAWEVKPVGLLGVYMSRYTSSRTLEDVTYLRFAFAAEVVKHHTERALETSRQSGSTPKPPGNALRGRFPELESRQAAHHAA